MIRLTSDTLILVADGRRMLLLRNTNSPLHPQLAVEYGEDQPNPADRDQKTDAGGQMPADGTPGQTTVGETDFHEQTEARFARHIARHLNDLALKGGLGKLIVVAPPKVLGQLRPHFHKEVQRRIVAEVGKDMTRYSTDRVAQMLLEADLQA